MNSMMRGITQKKARKQAKVAYIRQLEATVGLLTNKVKELELENARIKTSQGSSMPDLFANDAFDSLSAEEPLRGMPKGKSEVGEIGKAAGEISQQVATEKISYSDPRVTEAEGD